MHPYYVGEKQEEKRSAIFRTLVIVALVLTPITNDLLTKFFSILAGLPILTPILSFLNSKGVNYSVSYLTIYSILCFIANVLCFELRLASVIGIPDVRGTWKGSLKSNYGGGTCIEMTLYIKQTLTKISCTAVFSESSSKSEMAQITQNNDHETSLIFTYKNETHAPEVIQRNYLGLNQLTIRENKMSGFYFTNRKGENDSFTHGSIQLTKEKRSAK